MTTIGCYISDFIGKIDIEEATGKEVEPCRVCGTKNTPTTYHQNNSELKDIWRIECSDCYHRTWEACFSLEDALDKWNSGRLTGVIRNCVRCGASAQRFSYTKDEFPTYCCSNKQCGESKGKYTFEEWMKADSIDATAGLLEEEKDFYRGKLNHIFEKFDNDESMLDRIIASLPAETDDQKALYEILEAVREAYNDVGVYEEPEYESHGDW